MEPSVFKNGINDIKELLTNSFKQMGIQGTEDARGRNETKS
jgi:hypothetical protein